MTGGWWRERKLNTRREAGQVARSSPLDLQWPTTTLAGGYNFAMSPSFCCVNTSGIRGRQSTRRAKGRGRRRACAWICRGSCYPTLPHNTPIDLPSPSSTPHPQALKQAPQASTTSHSSTRRAASSSSSHECPRRDHLADHQPPVLLLQIQVRSKWSMLPILPPSLPPSPPSRPTPTQQPQRLMGCLL